MVWYGHSDTKLSLRARQGHYQDIFLASAEHRPAMIELRNPRASRTKLRQLDLRSVDAWWRQPRPCRSESDCWKLPKDNTRLSVSMPRMIVLRTTFRV